MYPYGNYQIPQIPFEYSHVVQQDSNDLVRQLSQLLQMPQIQQVMGRFSQLERQVNQQQREIDQLQRRLVRVNQRLRAVENRLNIPFTPFEGEF
ncbi:hypothetical protein HPT25_12235 [Bacillus sp. BRMEA1]|uniref:hypothetical protein n=1 Tax=Neobacillus endophyticus TaxID=2738405 RepID=UPI00156523E2|nr:hypothetical protein [Neobacillus endophyticus]NRD78155.1 hypothetical protein [Neobacillus endophyticus]